MQHSILAIILAFIIVIILGPIIIPVLSKLKFGQMIREDGPRSHLKKAGTPTMGGILMLISLILVTFLLTRGSNNLMLAALLVTLGYGIIGFIDDFIKIVRKRSLGLRAYQKLIGQIGIAAIFAYYVYTNSIIGSSVYIPFTDTQVDLGIMYIPITVFIIVGTVNSVNLTDGLDGLAAGVTTVVAATFTLICLAYSLLLLDSGQLYYGNELSNVGIFAGALTGACLGFLRFNSNPAQVFMGDTGSLALGGAVASIAIVMKLQFFLPIMGGIYVIETLSVILQVAYFKLTGKRMFRMSPIHHHFELKGLRENKVVTLFVIATIILCLITILALN
ncbi:MAG TPA: phospho-N-acetylmuramoyl-pentapeptide-transferase [Clostridiales bacterium]|nr:phospho-N-acetylmuramoyl-pentapeptide-transferase [Clostridiales bacterium]